MKQNEAVRLVAMLAAYFNLEMGEDVAILWARELVHFEIVDGLEAARELGVSGRFFPSLAGFVESIRTARNARLLEDPRTLPLPKLVLGASPSDDVVL